MTKYLFEVTVSGYGQTTMYRTFAPNKEEAIKNVTTGMKPNITVDKVEQKTFTPAKTATPKIC